MKLTVKSALFSGILALFMLLPACTCHCDKQNVPEHVRDWEDSGSFVTATGKGSRKDYAIADAWKKAMWQVIEANIADDTVHAKRSKIERLLGNNWQRYTTGNWQSLSAENIVYNWDRDEREITIRVHVRESLLLRDVERVTW